MLSLINNALKDWARIVAWIQLHQEIILRLEITIISIYVLLVLVAEVKRRLHRKSRGDQKGGMDNEQRNVPSMQNVL